MTLKYNQELNLKLNNTNTNDMKKIIIFISLVLSVGIYAQKYVPFPSENAEWNVFYASSWNGSPMDTTLMQYSLQGDTTINGIGYHKVVRNIATSSNPVYKSVGGLREQNKKVYYNGFGYNENYGGFNNIENLLYDFNKKVGDTVQVNQWLEYTITKIDSVKIGNEYRKRYNDCIIEGIGDVEGGLFGIMVLIPTCLDCHQEWHFVCFSQNGESVYKNPDYVDCNSTQKLSEKKYLANDACWTYSHGLTTINSRSQTFLNGDTVINNIAYKKVYDRVPNVNVSYQGAIREDSGKIYANIDNNYWHYGEFLLYDFTVQTGDTIKSNIPATCSCELAWSPVITKIDTIILLNGEKRKRFFFDSSNRWIEGIGNLNSLFFMAKPLTTSMDEPFLIGFKQNAMELYADTFWCPSGDCSDMLDAIVEIRNDKSHVDLSPNPITDTSMLKWDNAEAFSTLTITDLLGKTVQTVDVRGKSEISLNKSDLNKGLYVGRLVSGTGSEATVKIIVQ